MPKQTRKTARTCNPSRALTLDIPEPMRRTAAACAAHNGEPLEKYVLAALLARIRCDVDYIRDDAMTTMNGIEEGRL